MTGAAGFIGSHIARRLLASGHDVYCIDNLSKYYSRELKRARFDNLVDQSCNLEICDLSEINNVIRILRIRKFDVVLHLAGQPGVRLPMSEFENYTRDNLVSFTNLLLESAKAGVSNFLYASSSSVYGSESESELSENASNPSPISFYGATKLANEFLARSVSRAAGMKTRGLRFFTVYGPWGRPDMMYFRSIACALGNYQLELFGNGAIERDFTFIDDATLSLERLIKQLESEDLGFSDVVNIGGGNPVSINRVLGVVEDLVGKKIFFVSKDPNPNDVSRTEADFTYLRELVGTVPNTRIEEGMNEVFKWAHQSNIRTSLSNWASSVF